MTEITRARRTLRREATVLATPALLAIGPTVPTAIQDPADLRAAGVPADSPAAPTPADSPAAPGTAAFPIAAAAASASPTPSPGMASMVGIASGDVSCPNMAYMDFSAGSADWRAC